jgi:hypothetical protein
MYVIILQIYFSRSVSCSEPSNKPSESSEMIAKRTKMGIARRKTIESTGKACAHIFYQI